MKIELYVVISFIILLGFLLGGCASIETRAPVVEPGSEVAASPIESTKERWEVEWERLVAAAKREGKVSIYNQWGSIARVELTRAFKERFGIDIEFTSVGKGAELLPKLARERQAGLYLADIIGAGATTIFLHLKPAGILAPLEPMLVLPEVIETKYWVGGRLFFDEGKLVIPLSADFQRRLAYNTNLVKEGEIKSFYDLLDPKWKGKIVLNDPTVAGAGNSWVAQMVRLWGLDKTKDYLGQFVKQEPVISRDLRLSMEWLAKGKYAINAAVHPPSFREFQEIGAPVARVRVKEGGSFTAGAGAIALPGGQLPNPNAAKVFINWLLTKEGQTVFSKGYMRPSARIDVSTKGFEDSVPMPGEPFTVENVEEIMLKGQLIGIAREIFAPLMK